MRIKAHIYLFIYTFIFIVTHTTLSVGKNSPTKLSRWLVSQLNGLANRANLQRQQVFPRCNRLRLLTWDLVWENIMESDMTIVCYCDREFSSDPPQSITSRELFNSKSLYWRPPTNLLAWLSPTNNCFVKFPKPSDWACQGSLEDR